MTVYFILPLVEPSVIRGRTKLEGLWNQICSPKWLFTLYYCTIPVVYADTRAIGHNPDKGLFMARRFVPRGLYFDIDLVDTSTCSIGQIRLLVCTKKLELKSNFAFAMTRWIDSLFFYCRILHVGFQRMP